MTMITVIIYITGYVAKMAEKKTHCGVVTKSLGSRDAASSGLINLKDRGGIFKPSASVVLACQEAERSDIISATLVLLNE